MRSSHRMALVAVLLTSSFFSFIFTPFTSAQNQQTAQECSELFNLVPEVMQRKVDGVFLNNPEVCTAFKFLLSRYQPGTQSSREGRNGILALNHDFAVRLYKYLNAYPHICIISAYRSNETQTILWNQALKKYGSADAARKWVAPPGSSMHNKGLAADLGCGMSDQIRAEAPKHNLQFRLAHEGWHVEPLGAVKGETASGGTLQNTSPTAALTQSLRQWLAPQQQQPQQLVTATPSQSASASQNPLIAFQEPQTIGGVSGQLTMTPAASTTNTVADRLEALAFPTTTAAAGTATTVPLVITGVEAAQIAPGETMPAPTYTGSGAVSPSQNTFISGDLSWQGAPQPTQTLTGFQATLANVRAILERILAFLTPFNARHVINGESHGHESLE